MKIGPGLYFILLTALSVVHQSAARNVPKYNKDLHKKKVFARVGENVILSCPFRTTDGNWISFDWIKDGTVIDPRKWRNYEQDKNKLLVSQVTSDDAGEVACVATTGFGSATVNIQLFVSDKETDSGVHTVHSTVEEIPRGQERPSFHQIAKYHRRIIQRPAGSSAKLKCTPSGNPRPVVTWLKDGKPLRNKDLLGRSKIRKNTLNLENLQPDDSGKYMCVLTNIWGSANASFSLEVIERILKKPQLVGPHPLNTTVREGETAFFLCQMNSHDKPLIQWLKQVPPKTKDNRLVTEVDNVYYVVLLNTSKSILDSSGVYISKLVLRNVSQKDAGTYACIGANTNGFNYTTAHLSVIESKLPRWKRPMVLQNSSSSNTIPVQTQIYQDHTKIIIIVMAIVVISSLILAKTCYNKSKTEEVGTKPVTLNPEPKQIKIPTKNQDPYSYSKFHQTFLVEPNCHSKQLIHGMDSNVLPSVHSSDHSESISVPSSTMYISRDIPTSSDYHYETISARHHHYYLN